MRRRHHYRAWVAGAQGRPAPRQGHQVADPARDAVWQGLRNELALPTAFAPNVRTSSHSLQQSHSLLSLGSVTTC